MEYNATKKDAFIQANAGTSPSDHPTKTKVVRERMQQVNQGHLLKLL